LRTPLNCAANGSHIGAGAMEAMTNRNDQTYGASTDGLVVSVELGDTGR